MLDPQTKHEQKVNGAISGDIRIDLSEQGEMQRASE
jgi:hypothetical protein